MFPNTAGWTSTWYFKSEGGDQRIALHLLSTATHRSVSTGQAAPAGTCHVVQYILQGLTLEHYLSYVIHLCYNYICLARISIGFCAS